MDTATRQLVRRRAEGRCEYCRLREEHLPVESLQIEHVIPKQHGGSDDATNLASACPRCNRRKGPNLSGIDDETEAVVQLFNPRLQKSDEHFTFQGAHVVGLTPTGRATIRVLDMNAQPRIRLRLALFQNGELE